MVSSVLLLLLLSLLLLLWPMGDNSVLPFVVMLTNNGQLLLNITACHQHQRLARSVQTKCSVRKMYVPPCTYICKCVAHISFSNSAGGWTSDCNEPSSRKSRLNGITYTTKTTTAATFANTTLITIARSTIIACHSSLLLL